MNSPEVKMEKISIKINLEGRSPFELQSPSKEVSNDLYALSQEGFNIRIPNLGFEYHIEPFGKSHVLVETPPTAGSQEVVVYGVSCDPKVRMTPEEVANRVCDRFGVDVRENITPFKWPESDSVQTVGNGESAYPCGTLFTSGTYSYTSSNSFSSPFVQTPPHHPTPTRPPCLPINNANVTDNDTRLATPHPVATPNMTIPNDALVAGTNSFNMVGDQCDRFPEDSAPAPANNYREGMVAVATIVHDVLGPVQKPQVQEAGEVAVDPLVIVLETPDKSKFPHTEFKLIVQDECGGGGEVASGNAPLFMPVAVESSSQESEGRLHGQHEQIGLTASLDKKAFNNQLVVGIGQQPRSLTGSLKPVPSFSRQCSLPEGNREKSSLSPLPRNASEAHLSDLVDVPTMSQLQRRSSLNLQINAREQTVDEVPQEPPASPSKTTLTTPTKNTPGTPTKGSLATPTKPLAIERQESVADPEQIEYVLPKTKNVVLCDPSPQDAHKPVMTKLLKVVEDDENMPSHAHSNCDPVKACDPASQVPGCEGGDACDSGEDCEDSAINFQVAPTSDSSAPSSSVRPVEQPDERIQQVHLLEHAMNGYCYMKDDCTAGVHGNLEFTQAVDQMKVIVEEARNGKQDEDLKDYIRIHCGNCRDANCKVPHRMAGCPPPGETFSSSDSDQTDSPQGMYYQESRTPESPVTYDMEPANQSTTSAVERHNAHAQAQDYPIFMGPLTPITHAQQTSDVETTDLGVSQDQDGQTVPFSPLLARRTLRGAPQLQVVPPGAPSYVGVQKHFVSEHPLRTGCTSPMGSTGFFPTDANLRVRGGHQQESQLGAESYLYQVSDKGQTDIKPRERGQYQYIEPSKSGSGLRKMYGTGDTRPMTVRAGEFPTYGTVSKKPGTVIYAAEGSDLIPGESYPCPHSVPDRDRLGKGGNGTVVKFPLGGKEYALKLTQYRESELNIWSTLKHRNIVPLLGVMMADQSRYCYQFMPRMTDDLRSMMMKLGDLLTHLQKNPKEWGLVFGNVTYILKEVLNGLCYLDSQNIQHSDLKAQNILIGKRCACPDILHCVCTGEDKFEVKIADFDSIKKNKFSRKVAQFSDLSREPMNEMEMNGVKGTPAYRAPEQFKNCPKRPEFKRTLEDGKSEFDMEGPWCDMWSLGVIVMQMVLGSHNKGPYIYEANILTSSKVDKMHARVEATVATLRRSHLHYLAAHTHPELRPLARVVEECLKVDFRMRSTAEDVLSILENL